MIGHLMVIEAAHFNQGNRWSMRALNCKGMLFWYSEPVLFREAVYGSLHKKGYRST